MSRENRKTHRIAVVGCGTVGGATAKLLVDDRDKRLARSGSDLELAYIVDRNFDTARSLGLDESLFTSDLDAVLADADVSVVIELVGGKDFAKELISKSLKSGKHVVTANKALLAYHGPELFATAREHGVSLAFEASCGGGIPIIRALTDGLAANEVDALFGIVNGTCNYILTEMIDKGQSYEEALSEAQATGLAEADPTLDVNGSDSAHKIAIMGSLAFGVWNEMPTIPVKGIDSLKSEDVAFGAGMGYVIKLIASAIRTSAGNYLRVEPSFIAEDHPLAWVSGSFNAVSVYGHSVGHTMYYGRGAGGEPTASAVVADVLSIANGSYPALFETFRNWPDTSENIEPPAANTIHKSYYIRLNLIDRTGILSEVTAALAQYAISVRSILQHEAPEDPRSGAASNGEVPLIITTHRTEEAAVDAAIKKILAVEGVGTDFSLIPILDEHPEFLSL